MMTHVLTRSASKRRKLEDNEAEDLKSLVLFLLGSLGYEHEADRVARCSTNLLKSDQIVEGISRYQFPRGNRTRLMYAAMVGNIERLHFITGLGARVNMTTSQGEREVFRHRGDQGHCISRGGNTALHFACDGRHLDCVELLIEQGAVDVQNAGGYSALHAAVSRSLSTESIRIVRLLCKNTPLLDAVDLRNGWSPLMHACDYGRDEYAKILCAAGVSLDLQSPVYGTTALMIAIPDFANDDYIEGSDEFQEDWASFEKSNGIDTDSDDDLDFPSIDEDGEVVWGDSADEYADQDPYHDSYVEVLLDALNQKVANKLRIVRLLCDLGARLELTSSDGITALQMATSMCEEAADIIKEYMD